MKQRALEADESALLRALSPLRDKGEQELSALTGMSLAERVELAAHRTTDGLQICVDEKKRQGVRDAFRAMNFQVQSWIGEMGKPQ